MQYVELGKPLLPAVSSALGLLLDISAEALQSAWRDLASVNRGYSRFTIAHKNKKRGREVHVPSPNLTAIQQRILQRVLYPGPVSSAAYGGVPGRSYVDAARLHLARPGHVLQLDVADAFPSTRYGLIAGALRKRLQAQTWMLALKRPERAEIAGVLAHFITVQPEAKNAGWPHLPLGAPSSVAAFNLVWLRIDRLLLKAFAGADVCYTRYVDDLVFSGPQPLPADCIGRIGKILKQSGYRLNPAKQRNDSTDNAVIYGLALQDDGAAQLGLAPESAARLRSTIDAAQAYLQSAGSEGRKLRAAATLRGIDGLLRNIYGAHRPPALQFAMPAAPARQMLATVDELWL